MGCGASRPRELLTLDILREHRAQGLWCVVDSTGGYVLSVRNNGGKLINVTVSFAAAEDIDHMVSYRWKEFCTVPENGTMIAANFRNVTAGRGRCWVDSLNHLNDETLKTSVLENMGELYRTHKTVAEYFLYRPGTMQEVFRMLAEATRGWMWQELTLGHGVVAFGSNVARLCLEMLRLGKDWYHKATGDDWVLCMSIALDMCAEMGPELDKNLEQRNNAWWEAESENRAGHEGLWPLLDVANDSVERVAQLVEERDRMERLLMSAASNLMNRNIGSTDTFVKPDIIEASLAVVSTLPEFAAQSSDNGQEAQLDRVLAAIEQQLLRSALHAGETGIAFSPVASKCMRLADLFGLGITTVTLARALEGGPSKGKAWVTLGGGAAEGQEHRFAIESEAMPYKGDAMAVGQTRQIASIHVKLLSAEAEEVDVVLDALITACGLRLSFNQWILMENSDTPKPTRRVRVAAA